MSDAPCRIKPGLSANVLGYYEHDWRLIEETPSVSVPTQYSPETAWGKDRVLQPGVRRWYCTRCRTVETTDV